MLPDTARSWFVEKCPIIEVVQAVRGDAAISTSLFVEVVDAAGSCGTS
ncbi:hypothetical protein BH23ACT9_BH23ACT9_36200 [soil metagenome]